MSLRKSPELTPELLAAKRKSARLSTGPRTPAGKQNSKLNALKHGQYAAPENHYEVMLALGEDPEEFDNLKQELMSAFAPGEALWEKQVEDIAKLYWRRERLERAQAGLKRRALQAIDDWQHHRQEEMARVTFDASQHGVLEVDLSRSADRGVELRKTLSYLELVREEVKQRTFRPRQVGVLESLYQDTRGWRQGMIFRLLQRFNNAPRLAAQQADEEGRQFLLAIGADTELPGEPEYQELLRLLEEEIASVREEFAYAERENAERAAIERDACLAPEGETWRMMLRQEASLDRSIDRKVRILLALRRQCPAGNLPNMAADGEEQVSGVRCQVSGLRRANLEKVLETATPSQSLQTEGAKMTERSLNVIENNSRCQVPGA